MKLIYDGIITIARDLFKQSGLTEIESLLANSILQSLQYNSNKHAGLGLFKSYLVRKIIGKLTDKPYKKSCLIVQGYNNIEKTVFLTQAPTI